MLLSPKVLLSCTRVTAAGTPGHPPADLAPGRRLHSTGDRWKPTRKSSALRGRVRKQHTNHCLQVVFTPMHLQTSGHACAFPRYVGRFTRQGGSKAPPRPFHINTRSIPPTPLPSSIYRHRLSSYRLTPLPCPPPGPHCRSLATWHAQNAFALCGHGGTTSRFRLIRNPTPSVSPRAPNPCPPPGQVGCHQVAADVTLAVLQGTCHRPTRDLRERDTCHRAAAGQRAAALWGPHHAETKVIRELI